MPAAMHFPTFASLKEPVSRPRRLRLTQALRAEGLHALLASPRAGYRRPREFPDHFAEAFIVIVIKAAKPQALRAGGDPTGAQRWSPPAPSSSKLPAPCTGGAHPRGLMRRARECFRST